MTTLKKWQFFSKLGSQPPLKSAYPGSCPPKKLFLGRFFLENHFFDPFRPNEDPQVLYMAGKLWISSLWWYKEKNIFLHPVERMIFWDAPHRYFPLYWEAVIWCFELLVDCWCFLFNCIIAMSWALSSELSGLHCVSLSVHNLDAT